MKFLHYLRRLMGAARLAIFLLGICVTAQATEAPVTFSFVPILSAGDPWAREIWAEVGTPSGKSLRVPAFYVGEKKFSVRVRAEEVGEYRLLGLTEQTADRMLLLPVESFETGGERRSVDVVATRPMVRISSHSPARFVFANGARYFPIGANLAWATDSNRVGWYEKAFEEFSAAGLNWTRVWMANWGGLNLDWLPKDMGRSPPPGQLDERVAANWDAVVSSAEDRGIYLQIVLQHHGQFSTKVNPNWDDNPWNAVNAGGFLHSPTEFFTSAEAARLTRQKYRYIIARWGYSAAVLAWELFNEVHWVDALHIAHDEATVARWHDDMAAYIRSVDIYRHLVTTSTDDVKSSIYRSMDYLQPHLYATNMLAAVRRFDLSPAKMERPIFYGEIGNDNMRLSAEQKASGVDQVPIAWASLMGEGHYAGQIWEGDKVLAQGRVGELAALSRFITATGIAEREQLEAFSAAVTEAPRVPLVIEPGENWHRRPAAKIVVYADGRQNVDYGIIPRFLVGAAASVKEGFPNRTTLVIDMPAQSDARLRLASLGSAGAEASVLMDGKPIAGYRWPALAKRMEQKSTARPAELTFAINAGAHELVIENRGGKDPIKFESLDMGIETSVLTTMGRRGSNFVALWVFHRAGVFALKTPVAVAGVIQIPDVPAGKWQVTWWDTFSGKPAAPVMIEHAGGVLQLRTPPIARHAAVVLSQ
jgi:hypothetical protein